MVFPVPGGPWTSRKLVVPIGSVVIIASIARWIRQRDRRALIDTLCCAAALLIILGPWLAWSGLPSIISLDKMLLAGTW